MGTNYYADQERDCPNCDRTHVCLVHLGKSSGGWKFTYAWNDGEHYATEAEMREFTKTRQIYNEYDEKVTYKEFWDLVDSKKSEELSHSEDDQGHIHVAEDGTVFFKGEFS